MRVAEGGHRARPVVRVVAARLAQERREARAARTARSRSATVAGVALATSVIHVPDDGAGEARGAHERRARDQALQVFLDVAGARRARAWAS